jgi:hypothetical protein
MQGYLLPAASRREIHYSARGLLVAEPHCWSRAGNHPLCDLVGHGESGTVLRPRDAERERS